MRWRWATLLTGLAASLVASCALVGQPEPTPGDFRETAAPPPAGWTEVEAAAPVIGGAFAGERNVFISDATAFRDGFVMVGDGVRIWFSPDGEAWSEVAPAAAELATPALIHVATNGDRLVAMAITGGEGSPGSAAWVSDDGRSWRATGDLRAFAGTRLSGLEGSRHGFLAWGRTEFGEARVLLSQDGVDWDPVETTAFAGAAIESAAAYRGGWLAAGHGPDQAPPGNGRPDLPARAWWSADGATWQAASLPADAGQLYKILAGAGGVLAVGRPDCLGCIEPGNLYQSDDGRSWRDPLRDPFTYPQYAADSSRIIRWDDQGDRLISWSTNGVDWHWLDRAVESPVSYARLHLGPNAMLLELNDQGEPALAGAQLLRVR